MIGENDPHPQPGHYRNIDGFREEDGRYAAFMKDISAFIPDQRQFTDPVRTFAYGTDASFYRLNPKLVVKVNLASAAPSDLLYKPVLCALLACMHACLAADKSWKVPCIPLALHRQLRPLGLAYLEPSADYCKCSDPDVVTTCISLRTVSERW